MITMFKEDTKRELLSQAYKKAFDYLKYPEDERGREARKNFDVRLTVSDIMMSNLKGRTSILHKSKISPTKEKLWNDKPFLIFPGYPKWIFKLPITAPKFMICQDQAKLNYLNELVEKKRLTPELYIDMVSVLDHDRIRVTDIKLML